MRKLAVQRGKEIDDPYNVGFTQVSPKFALHMRAHSVWLIECYKGKQRSQTLSVCMQADTGVWDDR